MEEGEGGGEREGERKRAREWRGEGWLSVRRGSELKKASRREPSVWMHSLFSKKNRTEERGGNGGQNTGQLPPLPQADLWVHTCTSACSVIYIMRKCFCCPRLRYQREKTEQKWLQGGQECRKHSGQLSPGAVKRGTSVFLVFGYRRGESSHNRCGAVGGYVSLQQTFLRLRFVYDV